jgi:serine/threonine protein kinase
MRIAQEIALGMYWLASNNIVHLDLKTSNCLVSASVESLSHFLFISSIIHLLVFPTPNKLSVDIDSCLTKQISDHGIVKVADFGFSRLVKDLRHHLHGGTYNYAVTYTHTHTHTHTHTLSQTLSRSCVYSICSIFHCLIHFTFYKTS